MMMKTLIIATGGVMTAEALTCMQGASSPGASTTCASVTCNDDATTILALFAALGSSSSTDEQAIFGATQDACGVYSITILGQTTTMSGCMGSGVDTEIDAYVRGTVVAQASAAGVGVSMKRCSGNDCNASCAAPSDATTVIEIAAGNSSGIRAAAVGAAATFAAFLML